MNILLLVGVIALAAGLFFVLRKKSTSDPYEPPAPATLPPSRPLLMGYYGVQDGQIAATAPYVNVAHIGAWGDWVTPEGRAVLANSIVGYAKEAVGAGVTKLIFTLDWCLFTQTEPKKLLPESTASVFLTDFRHRLEVENLLPYVVGWYPIDEPNIAQNNISDADMTSANALVRAVLPRSPLLVIYGSNAKHPMPFPGIASFDWCGIDNYGSPIFSNGEYQRLVDALRPDQKTIYVMGGSNPWREDPKPYYMRAQSDARVAMLMPFAWFPSPDGIGFNGMQPAYDEVGALIVKGEGK